MSTLKSCHCCGIVKDMEALEIYLGSNTCTRQPVEPLLELDIDDDEPGRLDTRQALLCHGCFYKIPSDLWSLRSLWEAAKPITAYKDLPTSD